MHDRRALARAASRIERGVDQPPAGNGRAATIGITGPAGAGKSTFTGALTTELRRQNYKVAVIAVDPSSPYTGGALLGDRIRMQQHHADPEVFIRSVATHGRTGGLAPCTRGLVQLFDAEGFDYILIETVGVGQDEIDIARLASVVALVLSPGAGDEVQASKSGLFEIASVIVINKADLGGADQLEHDLEDVRPVVRTVARDGIGIREALDALRNASTRPLPARVTLDHIGIAVRSVAGSGFWSEVGLKADATEAVEAERVIVAMLSVGDARIELLEASAADSVIAKFIERRGPGLHHVALRVPDLEGTVATLKASGARLMNEPRVGAGGHSYVFVHPESTGGVLVELIQEQS